MSGQPSRSWATSILGFALAVLVACAALNWAARLLREALPVLLPAVIFLVVVFALWRWSRGRSQNW